MPDRMIPVPESLIERAKDALIEVPPSSRNADIYGELSALLSQPESSMLPHFCTPGCTEGECPVEPFTDEEVAELREVIRSRPGFDPSTIRDVRAPEGGPHE